MFGLKTYARPFIGELADWRAARQTFFFFTI
jgi:hypothetical protein